MMIKDLSMSFGTQEVFNDINLFIDDNEKIGVVGPNGSGKTTFFKIILGSLEPDKGKILVKNNTRIAWLPQVINDEIPSMNLTVLDFLLQGRPIDNLRKEIQDIYNELVDNEDDREQKQLYSKINKLQGKLDYYDEYNAESTLLKIIGGMNISDSLLDQKINTLSGGQKSKIAFARLLYSKPELILLDEPTNHLDSESKDFVIQYLKDYKGGVFVISHDIDFLNQVTTKTLYIDKLDHNMYLYHGNYQYFKKQRDIHEKELVRQVKEQDREIKKLRDIVLLYSNSSGKRKRMAESREKALEKIMKNKIELAPEKKNISLNLSINRESYNVPLRVKDLYFKYNEESNKNIIDKLSFDINKGERFLIVGLNGVGKSTLLKLIIGELIPDSGSIDIASKTDIGYYAQEHELLDNDKTIVDNFIDVEINMKKLRSILGRFLFHGDDIYKKVSVLSPGERSRVALANLSMKGANFLILDEPTNHLDPETQKIIADVFSTYTGTMLVVSHSPEFVSNLGIERTLELPAGKISYYDRKKVEYFENRNSNGFVK